MTKPRPSDQVERTEWSLEIKRLTGGVFYRPMSHGAAIRLQRRGLGRLAKRSVTVTATQWQRFRLPDDEYDEERT
jgi:hypothetical protein